MQLSNLLHSEARWNAHLRSSRGRLICVALCSALMVFGCGLGGDPDERVLFGKEPDELEFRYASLARFIQSEKPCYLISRNAITTPAMVSRGKQAKFLRSACFNDIAITTERPELCKHVVSVSTLLYAGHEFNRQYCIDSVEKGCCSPGTGDVDGDVMFELVGFSETNIKDLLNKHDIPPSGAYCLLYSREFFAAIENLPNFAGETDLEEMKAVEWRPHQLLTLQGFPCTGKFLHEQM